MANVMKIFNWLFCGGGSRCVAIVAGILVLLGAIGIAIFFAGPAIAAGLAAALGVSMLTAGGIVFAFSVVNTIFATVVRYYGRFKCTTGAAQPGSTGDTVAAA